MESRFFCNMVFNSGKISPHLFQFRQGIKHLFSFSAMAASDVIGVAGGGAELECNLDPAIPGTLPSYSWVLFPAIPGPLPGYYRYSPIYSRYFLPSYS
jgi:hypothetical protein